MKFKILLLSATLTLWTLKAATQTEFTVKLYDSQRGRIIPAAVYQPKHINKHIPVIIFNHGYGQNDTTSYKSYSCLLAPLAKKGYYVISVQHELPGDPLLAMTGDFMQTRMPHWEKSVGNILFTIKEFKKLKSRLDWNKLIIMGHSNGGDMTMLFASKYPEIIRKAISLDHRRMIMPRCSTPAYTPCADRIMKPTKM